LTFGKPSVDQAREDLARRSGCRVQADAGGGAGEIQASTHRER